MDSIVIVSQLTIYLVEDGPSNMSINFKLYLCPPEWKSNFRSPFNSVFGLHQLLRESEWLFRIKRADILIRLFLNRWRSSQSLQKM